MADSIKFTSPVGRLVMGSLYKPSTTDAEGKPLVVKHGPNAGQPRVNYFLALAVPKGTEQHWSQTPWGQLIYQTGLAAFPQAAQSASFAWKIEDGDSQVPNKKGRKPSDNEGWKGNWILKFSGGYSPKVYRMGNGGLEQVMEADFVKPGYFIEIAASVAGNGSQSQPGVYLNHSLVMFRAFGEEITFGMDVSEAGFGQSPLPAGASLTPPPSSVTVAAPPQATLPAPPVPVVPNAAFLNVPLPGAPLPGVPALPNIPLPPPVAASVSNGLQMTAKANGASYQTFKAGGWTDEAMIAQGYAVAF